MANIMLAAYPDVFAGGAIIAGLPFGSAAGVGQALAAMSAPAPVTAATLGDRVRDASTFSGPWPIVSVWHGGDDRTVSVRNGAAIAAQWADLHGATSPDGQTWRNAAGVAVVEFHEVAGMGHGTPIDSGDGGVAAPFMLDVGIASSARIAAFWGIVPDAARPAAKAVPKPKAAAKAAKFAPAAAHRGRPPSPFGEVSALINQTLRAAGLMK
jgi:poly(3-hydroxybutyrate) depolymerase